MKLLDMILSGFGCLIAFIIGIVIFWACVDDLDIEPDIKSETKTEPLDPEELIKLRYAQGEINSFEYTEKMARL